MNDVVKVTVFDAGNDLMEKVASFIGRQTTLGDDVVEELAARHVFVNKKDICWRVNDLIQPNNVWMSAEMQNINFSLHLFIHSKLLDLGLVEDLDRYLVPRHCMSR